MKGRFFASGKARVGRLHGDSLPRRDAILLIAAQNLSRRSRTEIIDIWTRRLSVLFAFQLKPLAIDSNRNAGVPSGLHSSRGNPYAVVWKPFDCIFYWRTHALPVDRVRY